MPKTANTTITGEDAHLVESGVIPEESINDEDPRNVGEDAPEQEDSIRDILMESFKDAGLDPETEQDEIFQKFSTGEDQSEDDIEETREASKSKAKSEDEEQKADTSSKLNQFLKSREQNTLAQKVAELQQKVNEAKEQETSDGSGDKEAVNTASTATEITFNAFKGVLEDLGLDEETVDGVVNEFQSQLKNAQGSSQEKIERLENQLQAEQQARAIVAHLGQRYAPGSGMPFTFDQAMQYAQVAPQVFGDEFVNNLDAQQLVGLIDVTPYAIKIIQDADEEQLEGVTNEQLIGVAIQYRNQHLKQLQEASSEEEGKISKQKQKGKVKTQSKNKGQQSESQNNLTNVKKRLVNSSTSEIGGSVESGIDLDIEDNIDTPEDAIRASLREHMGGRAAIN